MHACRQNWKKMKPLSCRSLIERNEAAWHLAIRHPFLEDCRSGKIQAARFNTWLVQDYIFVLELARMVARLLSVAPVHHFRVIISGLVALEDELSWFREKAEERGLTLEESIQGVNREYCHFLRSLASEPYSIQAVAYWAIELAYNQAWQLPGRMAKPYDEFAQRWGSVDFTRYVTMLEKQADEALRDSRPEEQGKVEGGFRKVAEFEKRFWQMAYEAN